MIKTPQALGSRSGGRRSRRRPTGQALGMRRWTEITTELKNTFVASLKAGGAGRETATKFKDSVPTVQNMKRAAGPTRGPEAIA